jgi:hypothetical protein
MDATSYSAIGVNTTGSDQYVQAQVSCAALSGGTTGRTSADGQDAPSTPAAVDQIVEAVRRARAHAAGNG